MLCKKRSRTGLIRRAILGSAVGREIGPDRREESLSLGIIPDMEVSMLPQIILADKRASVLRHYRHPWVFSRGIQRADRAEPGALVAVKTRQGELIGQAFYHPDAALALRMVSFDDQPVDTAFWRARLSSAYALRQTMLADNVSAYRLVHGENDGLPGLTVDVYGDLAVLAITSHGMEGLRETIAELIVEITGCTAVFEVSVGHARQQEGLPERRAWLLGERDLPVEVQEHGFRYLVDPSQGHKTGFYLDQRPQRAWVQQLCANKRVLDLCCYSGGFTLAALRGGAKHVTSVDASATALDLLGQHLALNELNDGERHVSRKADVFEMLKTPPEEPYDLVILDPPALAKSVRKNDKALRGYRHLNRDVAPWVKNGGLLLTFSCSGVVSSADFRQSVYLGMRDADVDARLVRQLEPGPDHPVHLNFPEGSYLKGLALVLTR